MKALASDRTFSFENSVIFCGIRTRSHWHPRPRRNNCQALPSNRIVTEITACSQHHARGRCVTVCAVWEVTDAAKEDNDYQGDRVDGRVPAGGSSHGRAFTASVVPSPFGILPACHSSLRAARHARPTPFLSYHHLPRHGMSSRRLALAVPRAEPNRPS